MPDRTLKVKCATWDHVENFYSQKVKAGNLLSARVPFNPAVGDGVTLSIELPNELVIAIECEIRAVKPAPDGKRSAAVLFLRGLTAEVSGQLRQLVEQGRARRRGLRQSTQPPTLHPPKVQSRTPSTELPVPIPMDAPINEIIEVVRAPRVTDVVARHRPVFINLEKHLRSLREAAAHEVLKVVWDASVSEIRAAYFDLTKAFHPDVFSKYRSTAITLLAQELFIYINKAYDRMRDAAVQAGHAIAAGPALIEHQGWFAGFEDIGTNVRSRMIKIERPKKQPATVGAVPRVVQPTQSRPISVRFAKPIKRPTGQASAQSADTAGITQDNTSQRSERAPTPPPVPTSSPPPVPTPRAQSQLDEGSLFEEVALREESVAIDLGRRGGDMERQKVDSLGDQARRAMEAGGFDEAREHLATALALDPRRRALRALYHVAYGLQLAKDGKSVDARTQFETALVHDRECNEAREAIAAIGSDANKGGLFRRFFR